MTAGRVLESDSESLRTWSTRRYFIGVDSGGTRTRALLADETGRVFGGGHAGSANRNHHTRHQILSNLRQAICAAIVESPSDYSLSTIFLGVGGVSTDADCDAIKTIVREIPEISPDSRVVVRNDTAIALTGGLAGRPGMALIAGTGSVCFGVNGRGEQWTCGGWGALADDIGSASWVGLRAVQAAVRAVDGRSEDTRLRKVVFDFLNLRHPRELIDRVHNQGLERADLGRLAPLVVEVCQQGDNAAAEILREAARGLSEMVLPTVQRLFGDDQCDLALIGGFALSGFPFQAMLTEQIETIAPNVQVREPEMPPVQGAVLEALRADGIAWTADILANLSSATTTALRC